MNKYLIFVLLMVSSSTSYSFSPNTDRCEFHFHGGSSDLDDLADLLKTVKPDGAVQVCTTISGKKGYSVASPISESSGISYFYLRRVFKVSNSDGYRWEYFPPKESRELAYREIYMHGTVGGDLRQGDSGFVQASDISAGLFSTLNKSWNGILNSEKLFDEASSDLTLSAKLFSDLKTLKRALYHDDRENIPELYRVDFDRGDDSSSPHYKLSVANKSRIWSIDFDFEGEAIKFYWVTLVTG